MSRQTAYFPLKKQADDLNFTIAAFDFETEGLGGKLLCATWYIDGMMEPEIILGDPDEIADAIIRIFEISGKSVRWYAHNAQYDWRYIVDKLVDKYEKTILRIGIAAGVVARQGICGRLHADGGAIQTARKGFQVNSSE